MALRLELSWIGNTESLSDRESALYGANFKEKTVPDCGSGQEEIYHSPIGFLFVIGTQGVELSQDERS